MPKLFFGRAVLLEESRRYKQRIEKAVKRLGCLQRHRLDSDATLLKEAFDIAYEAGLFDLHEYDAALHNDLKFELFSALTPISGSLAFLAVQILAANRIMQSNGFAKAPAYYKKKCGIIINHLRAPVTVIDAVKSDSGYRLSGRLTWASGYKIFDTLVVGFHHEGEEFQAVMPFEKGPGCYIGEPIETFVGESMHTVNMELDGFEIPFDDVISSHEIGHYTRQKSVSKTVHIALYAIGRGAVAALEDEAVKAQADNHLEALKEQFMYESDGTRMDALRIELFERVQKVITTGMILHGGRSMLAVKDLQRYYREVMMFNFNGLNSEIKGLFKSSFLEWDSV